MNKLLPIVVCTATLLGCHTRLTPEESWAIYSRYYSPTGETAQAPTAALDLRNVKAKQVDATLASLKTQGYVVLGSFKIDDDTDISRAAITALAQKLNAGVAVWSVENVIVNDSGLPNPDPSIAGTDSIGMAKMSANRPDASFAEQLITHKHTVWMLGKKK